MQLKALATAATALTWLAAPSAVQAQSPADDSARIRALEAQIQQLQQAVAELKTQQVAPAAVAAPAEDPAIVWKGAPQFVDKEGGWSFKPRGRLQYDFGTVDGPDGFENDGLGFSNEVRRARLGVVGTIPGDFGYKFEVDFASGDVEFADAFLSYGTGPWEFIVGHHNNFQSLEEITSSLHTSFIERAAFTDAFNFERRVGASAQYEKNAILAQGGVFTDSISDLNEIGDDNNSYSFDTRLVYFPVVAGNQLHFGGSFHWRDLNDAADSVRFRQRPALHTTDVRFIDTGAITGAEQETDYGLEAAGIFGPFYLASEAHWQRVSRGGFSDPTFFGAYLDAGYFFTGESRGYKSGQFDRVKVENPFGKGGWGALWANLRYDYLDLVDEGIVGGKQNAYEASLNWKPTNYVLFGLNVMHILYDDAAIVADGDRDYGVNVAAVRAQVDF